MTAFHPIAVLFGNHEFCIRRWSAAPCSSKRLGLYHFPCKWELFPCYGRTSFPVRAEFMACSLGGERGFPAIFLPRGFGSLLRGAPIGRCRGSRPDDFFVFVNTKLCYGFFSRDSIFFKIAHDRRPLASPQPPGPFAGGARTALAAHFRSPAAPVGPTSRPRRAFRESGRGRSSAPRRRRVAATTGRTTSGCGWPA